MSDVAAPETTPAPPTSGNGLLVLVTGTGRSGTSTISGTLHHLGLSVPGPYLGANKTNPKGFFESHWSVYFHKAIEKRAGIDDFDGRPEAIDLVRAAVTDTDRVELLGWLREHHDAGEQTVVKDPRSVWTQQLWRESAEQLGLPIRYLTMLRHPAEVVGSRATYYASRAREERRRDYEIASIARWVNSSLINERETRGLQRSFVPYNDLLGDWRTEMARVRDESGLVYNSDLTADESHPVDEFIDPDLRRVRITWKDLEIPQRLQDIAQRTWDNLIVLAGNGGVDATASANLDALTLDYAGLFADSTAICHDATYWASRAALREGVLKGREQAKKKLAAQQATARKDAAAHTNAPKAAPIPDRNVRDVTAVELLGVLRDRGLRRLRRRG